MGYLDDDSCLAFEFLKTYSFLEAGVKNLSPESCRALPRSLEVKNVELKNFVTNHASDFFNKNCEESVSFLLANPPKIQIISNNAIIFEAKPLSGSQEAQIIDCIRRVRNNVFHGGKATKESDDRNRELLVHSTKILKRIIDSILELKKFVSELRIF